MNKLNNKLKIMFCLFVKTEKKISCCAFFYILFVCGIKKNLNEKLFFKWFLCLFWCWLTVAINLIVVELNVDIFRSFKIYFLYVSIRK